jgi:predicted ester cyclase
MVSGKNIFRNLIFLFLVFVDEKYFIIQIIKGKIMATNQNQSLVRRFFDEMCNQQKLTIADELFSSDHAYHDPQAPAGPGPDGVKQVISTYQNAFQHAHWQVLETIVADNLIITRWKGIGTNHYKELNGIPPTGKNVAVSGTWIHRIANNKIVESYNAWDTLGLLQQLGVVPVGEQAEEAMAGKSQVVFLIDTLLKNKE